MQEADLEPEAAEVLQEEAALTAVPVVMDGPVRVQLLPRKAASAFARPVAGTRPVRVLTADHYRASAVAVAPDPFMVGFGGTAGAVWWPGGVPLSIEASVEVWVSAATDPDDGGPVPTTVSVITERWATGE